MTSDLRDLIESSFFMIKYLGMQPSEVDGLSTYEMRAYIKLALEEKRRESENEKNSYGALSKLFSFMKGKKS